MHIDTNVAIIGGGPGGLTLARILATRGISTTVFELDEHALARPQGGSLDIHEGSGQHALRLAGLEAELNAVARYEDQEDKIVDHLGALHFRHTGGADRSRPEVDRTQLRQLLLDSLPAGTVRWGTKVQGVEPLPGGRVRVTSEDGALGEVDLVVGADGAWSKVRPLLSPEQPRYSGVVFVELGIDEVDTRNAVIGELVGHGKLSALGNDGTGIIAQRNSGGHVRVYLGFRVPEDWLAKGAIDRSSPARSRADLKRILARWSPSLLELIDRSNDTIVTRRLVALPVGHRWTHRAGVTLLGDAAHVMSPFSGEGVNMAMLDAAELAVALADHPPSDWSRAIAAYEEQMFVRAAEAAAGAAAGLEGFFADDALAHAVAHFAGPPA